jgi:hypothetical protein
MAFSDAELENVRARGARLHRIGQDVLAKAFDYAVAARLERIGATGHAWPSNSGQGSTEQEQGC